MNSKEGYSMVSLILIAFIILAPIIFYNIKIINKKTKSNDAIENNVILVLILVVYFILLTTLLILSQYN